MRELGSGTTYNTHNTTSLIRTLKYVPDILQTEEAFTVKEYTHTHTHADAKNVQSVTLQVADKKGGPSQILRRPITKLVLLVENGFDSPTGGAISKSTKGKIFCGEPDEVV